MIFLFFYCKCQCLSNSNFQLTVKMSGCSLWTEEKIKSIEGNQTNGFQVNIHEKMELILNWFLRCICIQITSKIKSNFCLFSYSPLNTHYAWKRTALNSIWFRQIPATDNFVIYLIVHCVKHGIKLTKWKINGSTQICYSEIQNLNDCEWTLATSSRFKRHLKYKCVENKYLMIVIFFNKNRLNVKYHFNFVSDLAFVLLHPELSFVWPKVSIPQNPVINLQIRSCHAILFIL